MSFEYLCQVAELPTYPETINFKLVDGKSIACCLKDNEPLALPLYCSHMGAPLVEDNIWRGTCSFHGKGNGPCTHEATRIGSFVFLGKVPDSAKSQIYEASDYITRCTLFAREVTHGIFTRQMWLENTIDVQHIGFVHRGGFAELVDTESLVHKNLEDGSTLGTLKIAESHYQKLKMRHPGLVSNNLFCHAAIGPNLSITSFAGIFASIEKIRDCKTVTSFYANWEISNKLWLQRCLDANRQILKEDAAMLSKLDVSAYRQGTLGTEDVRIRHWRRHYA